MSLQPEISEVVEGFHQPKLCHEVIDLLVAWVLGLADVGAEVPYHYGISVLEACQGLLQVGYLIQYVVRGVCADDRGPLSFVDDLAPHHVWPVEARRLYIPALGSVPNEQSQSPLRSVRRRFARRRAHHVVSQPDATISLVVDIGLRQYHQVKASNLYRPGGLYDP